MTPQKLTTFWAVLFGFVATVALCQEGIQSLTLPTNYWSIDTFIGDKVYSTLVYNLDVACVSGTLFEGTPAAGSSTDRRKVQASSGQLMVSNCNSVDCSICDGPINLDLTQNYTRGSFLSKFSVNTEPKIMPNTYVEISSQNGSVCLDSTSAPDSFQIQFLYPGCFTTNTYSLNKYCNSSALYGSQTNCVDMNLIGYVDGCEGSGNIYRGCFLGTEFTPAMPPSTPQADNNPVANPQSDTSPEANSQPESTTPEVVPMSAPKAPSPSTTPRMSPVTSIGTTIMVPIMMCSLVAAAVLVW